MEIRPSTPSDITAIHHIHRQAFGDQEGPVMINLLDELLADPTALPLWSLVAVNNDQPVGHILFTRVRLNPEHEKADGASISAQILAPLAVLPEFQNQGIGGQLITQGLAQLQASGVELVFVLGHPGYYPRYGFQPAGQFGFQAPYPILPENADAWMVQAMGSQKMSDWPATVQCAVALDHEEYWVE
jgi:putative acetyltransferase